MRFIYWEDATFGIWKCILTSCLFSLEWPEAESRPDGVNPARERRFPVRPFASETVRGTREPDVNPAQLHPLGSEFNYHDSGIAG